MNTTAKQQRKDRRDHALRVLVAGLSGQERTNAMVAYLIQPDQMWEAYKKRISYYRRRMSA